MALRRVEAGQKDNILDFIPKGVTLLPNTSSARTAEEAVRIARLSREIGCGDFIKIEVMRDSKYLLPDNAETIKATEILAKEGFIVLPYMYPDLYAARALVDAGAAAIMPLASPIGTNKGLSTRDFIQILIDEIDLPIIVDAGIGRPSPGLRSHGNGRCRHHGQYGYRHSRQPAAHGPGIPQSHRSRSCRLSGWYGPCTGNGFGF